MKYCIGQNIKDWRGRDFIIRDIIPLPPADDESMRQRGWEPYRLTLEFGGRLRTGYVSTVDQSIHEAVRVDDAYPEGVNHAAQY